MFKALMLEKDDAGFRASVRSADEANCPAGDVTIRVEYSTLNYKDALAITNRSPIVRTWPMVAGIDGAGTVLESSHPRMAGRRRRRPQRLGRRRDALGMPRRARPAQGRRARRAAVGALVAPGDGDRHRRLHGHARASSRSSSTA